MAGIEWVVEAQGCDPAALADEGRLRRLFAQMIADLGLHPVGDAVWRRFPAPGGITGLCLLAESHLACHTFPEFNSLCLNLFCCRPRRHWDFEGYLMEAFRAASVQVRVIERPFDVPLQQAPGAHAGAGVRSGRLAAPALET